MERLVGSQAWLKEGVLPDGPFEAAVKAIIAYTESSNKKKK